MAIQVRRGNEIDFDASKMLPGEWAVSLDTRYVRMCFAPGVVLRMATYESFEADKAQIQAILAECKDIKSAIQRIQSEVNSKAALVVEYANAAAESAKKAAESEKKAKTYADNAEAVTGVGIATQTKAGLVKGGDNHIAEDGTLTLTMETTDKTMYNSHGGGIKIEEIGGKSEQNGVPTPDNTVEIKKVVLEGIEAVGEDGQKSTIIFTNPITLNGIGDVKDRIVRKVGVWSIDRRFAELDLSTLEWEHGYRWEQATVGGLKYVADNKKLANVLTEKYRVRVASGMSDSVLGEIAVDTANIKVANNGEVYEPSGLMLYELAEPTFEPLPTADQIALNSLLSFDGTTHIIFDSEIEPTSLVEYGTSHVGALTLEAWNKAENNRIRTEEMTTALLMMNKAEDDGQPLS